MDRNLNHLRLHNGLLHRIQNLDHLTSENLKCTITSELIEVKMSEEFDEKSELMKIRADVGRAIHVLASYVKPGPTIKKVLQHLIKVQDLLWKYEEEQDWKS